MENNVIANSLERIAIALERIAESFEKGISLKNPRLTANNMEQTPIDNATSEIGERKIIENSEEENAIEKFLFSRNIGIKVVPPKDEADNVINSLADFLGNNYSSLRELLSKIKSNMQRGDSFELCIKDYTQKEVSTTCQFCHRLYEIAFLEQYKYFKSPIYLIKAKTTTLSTAQNFFSGKWLERFVLQAVQKAICAVSTSIGKKLSFTYLLNTQIILPNGNDFELDFIFCVNGAFYWIEAKTGDYQQHINKYSKMSKILGLDDKHSILVLSDIQSDKSAALVSLFAMSVYGLTKLESELIETIRKDINSLTPAH